MSKSNRFERALRWYPARWRSKYSQGMVALLEDTYGTGRVPLKVRLGLVKSGSSERARETGLIGSAASPLERQRAGSLLVLCGWGAFMLAGALFAKFSDNWGAADTKADRALVITLYGVVQWAGAAGALVVLSAAMLALPSLIRMLRSGDWTSVRRPILRGLCAGAIIVTTTTALVMWANHLTVIDRNGGLQVYALAVALWSLTVSVAVVIITLAVVSIARQLEMSTRTMHWLSTMAAVLTSLMIAILAAMLAWWSVEAVHAPLFMSNGIGNGLLYHSSAYPITLIIASLVMGLGLAAAIGGTLRALGARRDDVVSA
jgi:hypothetical protein